MKDPKVDKAIKKICADEANQLRAMAKKFKADYVAMMDMFYRNRRNSDNTEQSLTE